MPPACTFSSIRYLAHTAHELAAARAAEPPHSAEFAEGVPRPASADSVTTKLSKRRSTLAEVSVNSNNVVNIASILAKLVTMLRALKEGGEASLLESSVTNHLTGEE